MAGKTSEWRPGSTVCRCCLTEGCYKDISTEYFWMGKREVYAEMLSDTLNVSISYAQTGGRLICEPCIARLRDASDFKRQVQDCEKTFMNHLDPSTSKSSVHVEVESLEDVKMERVKVEKDASDDDDDYLPGPDFGDDDDDDDLDDEPLTKLASAKVKVPKKEAVEILDMLDTSQITVKRKASSKTKEPPKKVKKKEIVVKPTTSKAKQAAAEREKKKKGKPSKVKKAPKNGYYWKMTDAERENAATLMEFTTVRPFLSQTAYIKCFYCDSTFTETNLAATHLASHETPSRQELMETHLKAKKIVKVDVSDLNCRICQEKHTDLVEIRKHLILQHKKEFKAAESGLMAYDLNSKVGVFSCCTCKKGFNSFFVLNQHMNVHFSVVCETCGRGFSSYTRLMNHKIRHENGNYRCKICPEVFSNKHKLRHHVSKKHKITTKTLQPSKCPHCPERFSGYHPRMRHLKDVHGIVFTFECTDCKAVFPYRRLLTEHTNKIHKQNNQCDYCGKCFGTPTLLRIHAKSHTGEKNFICTICQKAYAYKKGLNRHMKTHNHTDAPPGPALPPLWGV